MLCKAPEISCGNKNQIFEKFETQKPYLHSHLTQKIFSSLRSKPIKIAFKYLPPQNIASKIGMVLMATIFGMAFGGWVSGFIFDLTGSYSLAFLNGIIWNVINILLIIYLMFKGKSNKNMVAIQN